ncbi:MAG TPA: hypothetical protein PLN52_24750, partial [Opitutaceae bacterium]|nr:hypothetical protein [Opitutaceae bacterium]
AGDIFFKAAVFYASTGTTFAGFKAATYSAAIDNYDTETAGKVALAWDAVGVPYGAGNFRAVNISTRAWVGTTSTAEHMVVGFVTTGSGSKNMLLRGVGPELSNFGIS